MYKIYAYKGCGTCRKALQWMDARGAAYEAKPIRETPPTKAELQAMLKHYNGEIRRLFNTSGLDYKAMKLKDRLPKMTDDQALDLLSKNGNLVKRPFLLSNKFGLVGFKEDEWRAKL